MFEPPAIPSGRPWTGAGALTTDKHGKDMAFLDTYAKERWEVGEILCIAGLGFFLIFFRVPYGKSAKLLNTLYHIWL